MSKPLTQARKLALNITRDVRLRDAYVRELIDTKRKNTELPPSEFNFAQVLCFGVVMCRGTLDEFINRNLNKPSDIKQKVRDALRISAYELLFLDKPQHVVVSQGVELVRNVAPKAAGLANCILRRMVKDAQNFPAYDSENEAEICARAGGMPLWLTNKFIEQYGIEQTKEILKCNLEAAPRFMVENPYKQGSVFVSDESAQKVASLVPVGGDILEIGAGRGTKTMLIARKSYQEDVQTNIYAIDVHDFKRELLFSRMQEENIPNVKAFTADACDLSVLNDLPDEFDCAFIDAPCSGTGTLRRHPEIRWNLQENDLTNLAVLQFNLLKEASKRVKLGGALIYATCSILYEENEDVISAFLVDKCGKNFEVAQEFFHTIPKEGAGDGHFAAVLRRIA